MAEPKTSPPFPRENAENLDKRIEKPRLSQEEMEFLKYVIGKKVQADINDDDDALARLHHMARTVVSAFLDVASKHPERVAKIVQHYDTLPCHFPPPPKRLTY